MINKAKRSFRATKPSSAHVMSNGAGASQDCSSLTLMFRVLDSFVTYALEDQNDECFPYNVEGKWHLELTKDEELESLVERAASEDLDNLTKAEQEEEIADNYALVDSIEDEIDHMTKDQLKMLEDVAN